MVRRLLPTLVIAATCGPAAASAAAQTMKVERRGDLRLEHAEVPGYPQLARTARISGTVEVEVTVKDGCVVDTKVESGPPLLATATVENIQSWRFHPLVNATFTTRFIYRLETNASLDPQNPKLELELPLLARITAVRVPLDTAEGKPAPQVRRAVAPVYPGVPLYANVSGQIVVRVTIGADGKVTSVKLIQDTPLLSQAAIDAARRWEFEPTGSGAEADLSFSFSVMPGGTSAQDLTPVFQPPFTVQLRGTIPGFPTTP